MNQESKSLRIGVAVIVCAIILRLAGSGVFDSMIRVLQSERAASFFIYLETGQIARFYKPEAPQLWEKESPEPVGIGAETVQPGKQETYPSFSAEDLEQIQVRYTCAYRPDLEQLLVQPLQWDLTGSEPSVLIVHTHATESYTKTLGETYELTSDYRTLDADYNMISVGDALQEQLEAGGVTVVHDRELHDYPSYTGSYEDARETILEYLAQYPTIRLILDLHRDAADDGFGGQMTTCTTVNGVDAARLMLVVGTDAGGLDHPCWRENLSLALKLQVMLERQNPGICRYTSLRMSRYNQDLLPGTLLVEVGSAGDTRQQAFNAVQALGQSILALAEGTATADSTR